MKFTCDKDELVKAINYAEAVISQKTTHNILQNVLFEAAGGRISISSTDLEVGFITSIPANIDEEGDITVTAKKLLELIKRLNPCNLIFEVEQNNRIKIYSQDPGVRTVIRINGIPRIDFPEIPKPVTEQYFEFPQKDFKEMIKKTIYAVSHEETRYYLNGVFFEKEGALIKMVATDGRRLSYIHKDYPLAETDFGKIIPKKVLNEIIPALGNEGMIKIAVGEKQMFFEINDMYFVTNLLDGSFPNYKQVIPSTKEIRLTLNTQELRTNVERVSPLSDNKTNQIILKLQENSILIIARNPDQGDIVDIIQTEYSGPEMEIGFNYQYLLDSLREIESDMIFMDIISANAAVVIRGINEENYLAIIMPMKITS